MNVTIYSSFFLVVLADIGRLNMTYVIRKASFEMYVAGTSVEIQPLHKFFKVPKEFITETIDLNI